MVESSTTRLADLSTSAKLVFLVLDRCGPLPQQGIQKESRLVARTVYDALSQLEENNLIEKRHPLKMNVGRFISFLA